VSRLITPSLLGAIDWYLDSPRSWKEKAYKDLTNQLGRVYDNTPKPAMELGIKFEDTVYAYAGVKGKGSTHFQWFVDECAGGVFQRKTKSIIKIDDIEYCLYGKMDVWFPDIIKDIKTTSNYKGKSHYLKTFQHKMYCFNEKIDKFRYLVAIFDDRQKIVDKDAIDYVVEDPIALEADVINRVKEAVNFLSADEELFKLFTTKFSK
jgi:hypothetical protein